MKFLKNTGFPATVTLMVAGLAAGALSCELVAAVDRDKIAAGAGGAGGAGGMAAECKVAEDCPDTGNECMARACDAGMCGAAPVADGTPLMSQTPRDCKIVQCNGAGTAKEVNDDTDVLDDNNPCTDDECAGGVNTNAPSAAGVSCGVNLQCDGSGACVGCLAPSDCPGSDDDCQQRTCTGGMCGLNFTAAGTPTSKQLDGDCQENRCDGVGNVISAAKDADLPIDGKACTDDVCMAGAASNPSSMAGVACNQGGGKVCDGNGACVECIVASTCPGVDTECQQRTCVAGICGVVNTPVGTPTSMQSPFDCKVVQCNGAGATETVPQDTDLPDDTNPCTNDLCSGGVPSHTFVQEGTSCGGMSVCSAVGTCVGCNTGADCPGSDTECLTRTCNANTCGVLFTPAGTPVTMQSPGDCKVNQCNGVGAIVTAPDDTDLPGDGNQCTSDVCAGGIPSHPPVQSGGACSQGGGVLCNGAGACVQCLVAGTCPGMDTDCQTRTCAAGMCGVVNAPLGTPTPTQTPGDCKSNQCDGSGGVTQVNANDPFIDANQCTDNICMAGVPSNPPSMPGTPCNQMSGAVCDGASACVQCVVNADCVAVTGGACSGNICQPPACNDAIKNGQESDVDCGGSCPMQCALGNSCSSDGDCTSGTCTGNVCSLLNGCDMSTATDYTLLPPPAVAFGGANGLNYVPKCIKVKAGAMVTFNGNFASHPLLGGTLTGGMAIPAATGPFVPVTNSGATKTFTMSSPGQFPYYCMPHVLLGMVGVVYVVP